MNTYLLLFVISTSVSLVLTPLVSRISNRFGWLECHTSLAFGTTRRRLGAAIAGAERAQKSLS